MNAPDIAGLSDLALISSGSTFTIWKARQTSLDRNVEVRQFSTELTEAQVAHHIRMSRLLSKLNHASLTQIYDVNPDATPPYILAEYTDSPSLSDIIENRGVFSAKEALLVAASVAEALAYAGTQAPLIIRNLKPQNIRLDAAGNLKLTDFSLAIVAHDPEDGPAIDGDDLVGTPNFVSPEHAEGSPDIDQRSDMYSLGMVLYYLVTRKIPFDIPDPFKTFELQKNGQLPSPREANPALTPQFVAFLSRLTMKDPQNRYDTWGDVLADVRRILSGKPPASRKLPPGARSTIVLQNTVVAGGVPVGPTPELDAVAGKGKKRHHPLAWLILLLWLAWLANCRLANPLHLPEKFAPQITIPALDAIVNKQSESPKPEAESQKLEAGSQQQEWPAESDAPVPQKLLQQIPPNPYATINPPRTPTSGDPLEDRARPQSTPALGQVASRESQVDSLNAPAPTPPPQPPVSSVLADAIGDLIRRGDLEAAKAKCDALGTPEAKAAAVILSQIPSPDEAVGSAILTKKGQIITITYMGKPRTITPVRLNGSALVVNYTEPNGMSREITLAVDRIDAGEKIAFLNGWAETPQQHAAAAIAALQMGYEATFRRHAADAGAIAGLLLPR